MDEYIEVQRGDTIFRGDRQTAIELGFVDVPGALCDCPCGNCTWGWLGTGLHCHSRECNRTRRGPPKEAPMDDTDFKVASLNAAIKDLTGIITDGKPRKVHEVTSIQSEIRRLEAARESLLRGPQPPRRSILGSWASRLRKACSRAWKSLLTRGLYRV